MSSMWDIVMQKIFGISNYKFQNSSLKILSTKNHDDNVLEFRTFIDANFDAYSKHFKMNDSHVLLHKVKLLDSKKTDLLKQKIKDLNYTLSETSCGTKFWRTVAFRIEKGNRFEILIDITVCNKLNLLGERSVSFFK